MIYNLYAVRDTVSELFKFTFQCKNDASAVRYVCDMSRDDPHYDQLELWRCPYSFDVETLDFVPCQKAIVALPARAAQAPSMPLGASDSVTVEAKK